MSNGEIVGVVNSDDPLQGAISRIVQFMASKKSCSLYTLTEYDRFIGRSY